MSLIQAQNAVEQAQAAYNANPEKRLKKALKAAKATLAAEEAKQQQAPPSSKKRKGEEPSAAVPTETPKKAKKAKKSKGEKEVVQTVDTLTAAIATAKTAYKADKTKDNKKRLKEAKAALTAFQTANAAVPVAVSAPPTPSDVLTSLKSNKSQAAAPEDTDEKKRGPLYEDPCNRVFVANLSWDVDDHSIKKFFEDCGTITKINWIEDKTTKQFKGCGVLDFETLEAAQKAVAKHDQLFMDRKIVAQYSRAQIPSHDNNKPRGNGTVIDEKQQRFLAAPLAPKPDGCLTCFMGNLSFGIEEDDIRKFAEDCGEITNIRWVYHKDSGEFKGCGFIDFADTEAVDKFVAKKGTVLKGRPIRIDYSESRRKP